MLPLSGYTRHQITVLFICVAIFALGQFHRASGGVFTPILMDRLALPAATIGGLVSAMFLATIVAQVPFGIALDKKGPRIVLTLCVLVVAMGTSLFAVVGTFSGMVISRILIGIGLAAMGAATHVIVARNFSGTDFGYVSGLVVTLGGIGGLLGTYPLAVALSHVPWPFVFGGVAVATFLLAGLVFRRIGTDQPAIAVSGGSASEQGFLVLLSNPEFLRILVLGLVTFGPITTITGLWGGPYLQGVIGLSAERAGIVLLLFFAATICAGYVFGVLDRQARSRKVVILSASLCSATLLLGLAILADPGAAFAITLLACMIFLQQFYIPLAAHMRQVVPDHLLGRASTVLSLVSVGAIPVMQIGFGAILDAGDRLGFAVADQYRLAFGAMAALIAICSVIYAFSRAVDTDGKPFN